MTIEDVKEKLNIHLPSTARFGKSNTGPSGAPSPSAKPARSLSRRLQAVLEKMRRLLLLLLLGWTWWLGVNPFGVKSCIASNSIYLFYPAIDSNIDTFIVSGDNDTSLSGSDSTKIEKNYPKYIRWSSNVGLYSDSLKIYYKPVGSYEIDVSDDAKYWYHLFCVNLKSVCIRKVKKYGMNHNFDFLKRVYLAETITDSLYHYTDYDHKGNIIYDLDKVDVDISLDERTWYHLFGSICKRDFISFFKSGKIHKPQPIPTPPPPVHR